MPRLSELEDHLGYRFRRPDLLVMATTHKSAVAKEKYSYEALEFLGDRVVNLIMADLVHRDTPDRGSQTRDWAQKTLKFNPNQERVARRLLLQDHIEYHHTGGPGGRPEKLLSDALEAILAAMYLDSGGLEVPYAAAAFWFEPELAAIRLGPPFYPLTLPDRVQTEMKKRGLLGGKRLRASGSSLPPSAFRLPPSSPPPSSLKPQASSLKPSQMGVA